MKQFKSTNVQKRKKNVQKYKREKKCKIQGNQGNQGIPNFRKSKLLTDQGGIYLSWQSKLILAI